MTWFGWVLIVIFATNITYTLVTREEEDKTTWATWVSVGIMAALILGTLFIGTGTIQ